MLSERVSLSPVDPVCHIRAKRLCSTCAKKKKKKNIRGEHKQTEFTESGDLEEDKERHVEFLNAQSGTHRAKDGLCLQNGRDSNVFTEQAVWPHGDV